MRNWISALACLATFVATDAVPLGSNFWPFGLISNPWPQTKPFVDIIYNTGGTAFATIEDPWNPDYLAEIRIYDHFRFMDWGRVNSSPVTHWADRRQKTDVQDCTFKTENTGVAYEWMAHLCNKMDADMWICIPHRIVSRDGVARGSNDFMRKLAILIKHGIDMGSADLVPLEPLAERDRAFFLASGGTETGPALEPDLKLYIEYSNETWNFAVQRDHCIAEGLALGLHADMYTAGFMFHAWAATRVFEEFEDVFGADSPRLVRVTATQTSGWQANKHLEIFRNPVHNPRGIMPDAFAGTFYAGHKDSSNHTIDGADTNLAAKLADSLHNKYKPSWTGLRNAVDQAMVDDGRRYLMVAYEGGQHITSNANLASENPVMYDFYKELLDVADNYYDVLSHYTHDGRPSPGGAWGAIKATTGAGFSYSRPTLEETIANNLKYKAIVEYIQNNAYPVWSEKFSWNDPETDALPKVDYDGDGYENIIEYHNGTDPTVSSDKPPGMQKGWIEGASQPVFSITFRRCNINPALTAVGTASTNLIDWIGPDAVPVPGTVLHQVQPDGKGYEQATYRLHDAIANKTAAFLRASYSAE